ncbi:hypothetical protein [Methylobacterium sp. A54F]
MDGLILSDLESQAATAAQAVAPVLISPPTAACLLAAIALLAIVAILDTFADEKDPRR